MLTGRSFLVERIVSLNSFGAPRTSRQVFNDSDKPKERSGYGTCGIWPLASHINHSCINNCRRSFIGDMQIVRATEDLDANTELVFAYKSPPSNASYEETQKGLSGWGFTCDCRLCVDKKATTAVTLQRRISLERDLESAFEGPILQLTRIQRLLGRLHQTYPKRQGVPRLGLWDVYFALGVALNGEGNQAKAIEFFISGLEALGYDVEAYPPGKGSKEPVLKITKWGYANEHVLTLFIQLAHAYKITSPQLSMVAKQYAELFYSIFCGEKDTFRLAF